MLSIIKMSYRRCVLVIHACLVGDCGVVISPLLRLINYQLINLRCVVIK